MSNLTTELVIVNNNTYIGSIYKVISVTSALIIRLNNRASLFASVGDSASVMPS
ncbi:MAG: hypothetical protein IPH77_20695 [Ignavibacteria bacterium]|nr:hypothetical protein [Ignavibacteria bacterium]